MSFTSLTNNKLSRSCSLKYAPTLSLSNLKLSPTQSNTITSNIISNSNNNINNNNNIVDTKVTNKNMTNTNNTNMYNENKEEEKGREFEELEGRVEQMSKSMNLPINMMTKTNFEVVYLLLFL